jgi:hypothetical protein
MCANVRKCFITSPHNFLRKIKFFLKLEAAHSHTVLSPLSRGEPESTLAATLGLEMGILGAKQPGWTEKKQSNECYHALRSEGSSVMDVSFVTEADTRSLNFLKVEGDVIHEKQLNFLLVEMLGFVSRLISNSRKTPAVFAVGSGCNVFPREVDRLCEMVVT